MAKPGGPASFKPEYSDLAQKLSMLGAINEDLARMFGVARRTIDNWIAGVPAFAAARHRQDRREKAGRQHGRGSDMLAGLDAAGGRSRHARRG